MSELLKINAGISSRRSVFAASALGLGAAFGASLTGSSASAAPAPEGAVIDKWIQTKKIVAGYEFGTPPMQYRDLTTNEPAGYTVELTKLLASTLGEGISVEFVEVPFGQLFALLESGRCDIIEPITNLPSRALRGDFTTIPAFYAPVYVVVKKGSTIARPEELNAPNRRFAVLQGTSQLSVAKRVFPKAQFATFPSTTDAINEVASGRADASVQSSSSVIQAIGAGAPIGLLPSGPLYVESVSYFIRQGDPKTLNWLNNFMTYQAAIGTLKTLYEKYIGDAAEKYKLQTVAVGPAGQPIQKN